MHILATIGLAAALNPIHDDAAAQSCPGERQSRPGQYQQPVDISPVKDGLADIYRAIHALKDNPEAAQEKQRAERDLAAQEGMAKWAYYMFWATVCSIGVSIAGLYLLLNTLSLTRKSTKAAVDAAETTKQALELAERPYFFLNILKDQVQGLLRIDDFDEYRSYGGYPRPAVEYEFKNYGRTPAVIYRAYASLELLTGLPDDEIGGWKDDFVSVASLIGMVGAQEAVKDSVQFESDMTPEIQNKVSGGSRFWLIGSCVYKDGLGVFRQFNIQYRLLQGDRPGFSVYMYEDKKLEGEPEHFF